MNYEIENTNQRIARLLQEQTYDERLAMAQWFRDVAADAGSDDKELDADWFAFIFSSWAEDELSVEEPTE